MEKIERILGLLLLIICNIGAIIICIGLAFMVLTTIEDYNTKEENKYETSKIEYFDKKYMDIYYNEDSILIK